jgi:ABC-type dipeptide/oligopeptide/nickel transport system permease component
MVCCVDHVNQANLVGFLVTRVAVAVATVLGAVTVVVLAVRAVPGDPAMVLMGEYAGQATPAEMAALRAYLGTDRSVVEQYLRYVARLLQGDLGESFRTHSGVFDEIRTNLPPTLILVGAGVGLAILIGLPVGVLAATHRNQPAVYVLMCAEVLGLSCPSFWFAILLVYFLSYRAGWFPLFGAGEGAASLHYLVLPALTIGVRSAALIARMTRSALLEVLGLDFVRTARAKGLSNSRVLYRHALRAALLPIITIVSLDMAFLLSGTVVIETVFSRPGLGKLLVDALFARDYPVVQGTIIVFAAVVVGVNALADIAYRLSDPRLSRL